MQSRQPSGNGTLPDLVHSKSIPNLRSLMKEEGVAQTDNNPSRWLAPVRVTASGVNNLQVAVLGVLFV